MATAWPGSLPTVSQRDGWSDEVALGVIRFRPDVGPSITRRRTSYAPDTVRKVWWMTLEQAQTFREFVRDDLAMGSLPFTYPDELLGVSADFRFLEAPTISERDAGTYVVSATLERL